MYKVMIVDDETIILSGIKSLVEWEKNDCELAATARNGQDALEQIRRIPIDIVLVDINMPVMDGITLMKKVYEEFPDIVFIVLTNLEEFELVRQAMQYHAVDYLLKSKIETSTLEKVLERAKEERGKRTFRTVSNAAEYFKREEQKKVISKVLQEILFFWSGAQREEYVQILKDSEVLSDYCCFYIPFDFAPVGGNEPPKKNEKTKVMGLISELAVKTAENVFGKHYILLDIGSVNMTVFFVWKVHEGKEKNWERKSEIFARKLTSVLKTVTVSELSPVLKLSVNVAGSMGSSHTVKLQMSKGVSENVDKSGLNEALEKAAALDETMFTEATWNALQSVIAEAESVAADEDADQSMVDAMTEAVLGAISALEEKGEEPEKPDTPDKPGTEKPDTPDKPGTDTPDTSDKPGTDTPDTLDKPGTDTPGTDEPGTDKPGTDETGTNKPGTDKPGTNKPNVGDSGVNADKPSKTVQTGDSRNLWIPVVCAGAAAIAVIGASAGMYKRKKR